MFVFCLRQDAALKKLAEFQTNDDKLAGISERRLSDLCAQIDQRLVQSWQQLKSVEIQQLVQTEHY